MKMRPRAAGAAPRHQPAGDRWARAPVDFIRRYAPIKQPAMRPEISRAIDDIQQAIALLRRHL